MELPVRESKYPFAQVRDDAVAYRTDADRTEIADESRLPEAHPMSPAERRDGRKGAQEDMQRVGELEKRKACCCRNTNTKHRQKNDDSGQRPQNRKRAMGDNLTPDGLDVHLTLPRKCYGGHYDGAPAVQSPAEEKSLPIPKPDRYRGLRRTPAIRLRS